MKRNLSKLIGVVAIAGIMASIIAGNCSTSIVNAATGPRIMKNSAVANDGRTVLYTVEDLDIVRNNLSGDYVLGNDIDLNGVEWTPIGTNDNPFTGTFDGNGYEIKNIKYVYDKHLRRVGQDPLSVGLFSVLKGATVKDLGVTGVDIEGYLYALDQGDYKFCMVGGLAGEAWDSTIERCFVTGNLRSCASGNAYARASAFGVLENSKVTDCYANIKAYGYAECANTMVAGIAAWNRNSVVKNCYSKGEYKISNDNGYMYFGGIVASGDGEVTNCVALYDKFNVEGENEYFFTDAISPYSKLTNNYLLESLMFTRVNYSLTPGNKSATRILNEEVYTPDVYNKFGWDFEKVWEVSEAKGFTLRKPNAPIVTMAVTPTPTAAPTTAPESDDKISAFVGRIYEYVLAREPEEAGQKYWSEQLYNFNNTGAEVAQMFIFSDEFVSRNTSNTEFISILYKTFFGREADDSGLNYWLAQLSSGTMDRTTVANGFIYSQEWADTCASYGIRSGGELKPSKNIEPTDLTYAFVERMYTTAMGRDYDEDGKQYWAAELANFNITGEQVGASFFLSAEMINYKLSDQEYLNRLYATFMNREADAEGSAYWLGLMASGATRESVVYGFTRSPEFTQKCVEARILPFA